jgi:L-methionine (R)-S-oxide reductase
MHHAEYSNFSSGGDLKERYEEVVMSAEALFADQSNWVCNAANLSSLLWHLYLSVDKNVNWAGLYVQNPEKPNELILGPFQGKVACQNIRIGKGVCGVAAETKKTQLVNNVEEFPGHIACDGETKSEIVVPIVSNDGQVKGVIDIDCLNLNGFNEIDQQYLEKLADLLIKYCKW